MMSFSIKKTVPKNVAGKFSGSYSNKCDMHSGCSNPDVVYSNPVWTPWIYWVTVVPPSVIMEEKQKINRG